MPIARTKPKSESELSEKPKIAITASVPINDYVFRLRPRRDDSQSVCQWTRFDVTQVSNVFLIDYVDKALILIGADCSVSNQKRVIFRTRRYSNADETARRENAVPVTKRSPNELCSR